MVAAVVMYALVCEAAVVVTIAGIPRVIVEEGREKPTLNGLLDPALVPKAGEEDTTEVVGAKTSGESDVLTVV